jgi:formylglycine-generating enzyme required for sulfatase activity
MVYIPAGAFHLGSGGGEGGHFEQFQEGAKANPPFLVTSEAALTVGNAAGNLYYQTNGCRPQHVGDQQGLLVDAFPKGYAAFYCMKYEISHGQYAEFLNKLDSAQAANRFPNQAGNSRHTLGRTPANCYTATVPDRACNFLSWADLAAYAAWAGLRPMTELEFEKACRGFGAPVRHEYAWGGTNIVQVTGEAGKPGSGTETAWPTNANACFGSHWSLQGPVRGGIFAVSNAPRQRAGAGYFGVLELSGNVSERCVTVGNPSGRAFQGTLGQGMLNANGNATNADWPGYDKDGVVGFEGAGLRGGGWQIGAAALPVSCRNRAVFPYAGRAEAQGYGGRAVRQAP